MAVLAIFVSGWFYGRKTHLQLTVNRPVIHYGDHTGWRFQIGAGTQICAELLPTSIATRWLVILHFRIPQKRFQSFVLFRDSLDPEDYRRLRMILKISEKKD